MSVLFMFPGQGAQRVGMFAALPDSRVVRETLEQTSDTLGYSVGTLDTAESLRHTQGVQLALTVAGVASARHLAAEQACPGAVIGLSIGAWPAAVVAGALDFADALRLVAERGRLMGQAFPKGYGMAAIIGLDSAQVMAVIEDAASAADDQTYLANVNADQQIVVAGSDHALSCVADKAESAGASRVVRLDMAVPSHCALLDTPADELAEQAGDTSFAAPSLAYFSANRKRRLWQAQGLRDDLIYNMARTVYWADTMRIAIESGFSLSIEMLPGQTLTGLYPTADMPGEALALEQAGWANAQALIRKSLA